MEVKQPLNENGNAQNEPKSVYNDGEKSNNRKSRDPLCTEDSTKVARNAHSSNSRINGSRKVQNVVIDIESDELTYGQARSIRLQI